MLWLNYSNVHENRLFLKKLSKLFEMEISKHTWSADITSTWWCCYTAGRPGFFGVCLDWGFVCWASQCRECILDASVPAIHRGCILYASEPSIRRRDGHVLNACFYRAGWQWRRVCVYAAWGLVVVGWPASFVWTYDTCTCSCPIEVVCLLEINHGMQIN